MLDSTGAGASLPPIPTMDDIFPERAYWRAQGMPWRSEAEISPNRQSYLIERRAINPNIKQGIYPFKGVEPRLTRADIEWLLATHQSVGEVGPVDWKCERTKSYGERREGLDLRGVDLSSENVSGLDLSGLPLARTRFGLQDWLNATSQERSEAAAHLAGVIFGDSRWLMLGFQSAHLEGASFNGANLNGASFYGVQMEEATLSGAHLEGADFTEADLSHAWLDKAYLQGATLSESSSITDGTNLEGARLAGANLEKATIVGANLKGANLEDANLEGAELRAARLQGAKLRKAFMKDAGLFGANLESATLIWTNMEGADLSHVKATGADFRRSFFNSATVLDDLILGAPGADSAKVADVHWGGANLAVIAWDAPIGAGLGDEQAAVAWKPEPFKPTYGAPHDARTRKIYKEEKQRWKKYQKSRRLRAFQEAVRANRQVATALHGQGMNEEGDLLAYRAQVLQRRVYRLQGKHFRAALWRLLDLVSGHGYKPQRSVVTYVVVLLIFAALYLLNGQFAAPHLTWDEALVLSISSFHGRGFLNSDIHLGDTLARLASGEAILGLLIEVSFIATFTQRFFGK